MLLFYSCDKERSVRVCLYSRHPIHCASTSCLINVPHSLLPLLLFVLIVLQKVFERGNEKLMESLEEIRKEQVCTLLGRV